MFRFSARTTEIYPRDSITISYGRYFSARSLIVPLYLVLSFSFAFFSTNGFLFQRIMRRGNENNLFCSEPDSSLHGLSFILVFSQRLISCYNAQWANWQPRQYLSRESSYTTCSYPIFQLFCIIWNCHFGSIYYLCVYIKGQDMWRVVRSTLFS